MAAIHIGNIGFMSELEAQQGPNHGSVPATLLQLQFLPLLFASPSDQVYVTQLPDENFSDHLLGLGLWGSREEFPSFVTKPSKGYTVDAWGASQSVRRLAEEFELDYHAPACSLVTEINDKTDAVQKFPQVPGSEILEDALQLKRWFTENEGKVVLKKPFGQAAAGNLVTDNVEEALQFCQAEWTVGRSVLGEPWLKRIFDFSTQWKITEGADIQYLGATQLENDTRGQYIGTVLDEEHVLFEGKRKFLGEHFLAAIQFLSDIKKNGYFGYVGLDAMIYQDSQTGAPKLQPIVEVNARQTMALAVIRMKKRFPHLGKIEVRYTKKASSGRKLLPERLCCKDGNPVVFTKNLVLSHSS